MLQAGDVTSLEKIKTWFRRATKPVEDVAHGLEPAETPAPGARSSSGDTDRETSTNAHVEGAVGEPYE
jgi:hypothetical protein